MQLVPKFRSWSGSWEVYFPKRGSVPAQRRFYPSEESARSAIAEWRRGDTGTSLSKRQVDEVLYVTGLLPSGVTLTDAVRFFIEHNAGLARVTVGQCAEAYRLLLKRQASDKYAEEQGRVITEVEKLLGAETVFSTIPKATLIETINAPETYWTRYGRKRAVSCLISKALELGGLKDNPLANWRFEKAPKKTPHVLSNEAVQSIMERVLAERPELVPCFALQLFAGIRTDELCRKDKKGKRALRWEDIDIGTRITVPIEVSKTGDKRVIDFWPAALTNWLNAVGGSRKGRICPVEKLDDAKSKLLSDMPEFQQNDFRRTFASNAYALHGAKTQDWMGHTDGRMLKKHYRDFRTPEQAEAFFASKPATLPNNIIAITA